MPTKRTSNDIEFIPPTRKAKEPLPQQPNTTHTSRGSKD